MPAWESPIGENIPCDPFEACSRYECKGFTSVSSVNFTFTPCLNITRIKISLHGNVSGTVAIHINNESEVFNISSNEQPTLHSIERYYQCATELQMSFAGIQLIDSIKFFSVTPVMTGR